MRHKEFHLAFHTRIAWKIAETDNEPRKIEPSKMEIEWNVHHSSNFVFPEVIVMSVEEILDGITFQSLVLMNSGIRTTSK